MGIKNNYKNLIFILIGMIVRFFRVFSFFIVPLSILSVLFFREYVNMLSIQNFIQTFYFDGVLDSRPYHDFIRFFWDHVYADEEELSLSDREFTFFLSIFKACLGIYFVFMVFAIWFHFFMGMVNIYRDYMDNNRLFKACSLGAAFLSVLLLGDSLFFIAIDFFDVPFEDNEVFIRSYDSYPKWLFVDKY